MFAVQNSTSVAICSQMYILIEFDLKFMVIRLDYLRGEGRRERKKLTHIHFCENWRVKYKVSIVQLEQHSLTKHLDIVHELHHFESGCFLR